MRIAKSSTVVRLDLYLTLWTDLSINLTNRIVENKLEIFHSLLIIWSYSFFLRNINLYRFHVIRFLQS